MSGRREQRNCRPTWDESASSQGVLLEGEPSTLRLVEIHAERFKPPQQLSFLQCKSQDSYEQGSTSTCIAILDTRCASRLLLKIAAHHFTRDDCR
jgi:hypothetical protein